MHEVVGSSPTIFTIEQGRGNLLFLLFKRESQKRKCRSFALTLIAERYIIDV